MNREQLEHAIRAACEVSEDISFVRTLLVEELVSAETLQGRIKVIQTEKVLKERALDWLVRITLELNE